MHDLDADNLLDLDRPAPQGEPGPEVPPPGAGGAMLCAGDPSAERLQHLFRRSAGAEHPLRALIFAYRGVTP